MFLTKKEIYEGSTIPKGWGVAYYESAKCGMVILPIPINWIVGLSRKFWFKLKGGPSPLKFEQAIWHAEAVGYARAYKQIMDSLETSKTMWDRVFVEVLKERGISLE